MFNTPAFEEGCRSTLMYRKCKNESICEPIRTYRASFLVDCNSSKVMTPDEPLKWHSRYIPFMMTASNWVSYRLPVIKIVKVISTDHIGLGMGEF